MIFKVGDLVMHRAGLGRRMLVVGLLPNESYVCEYQVAVSRRNSDNIGVTVREEFIGLALVPWQLYD